jgi:glycosyltransferase involved in cell wall biosynthesis
LDDLLEAIRLAPQASLTLRIARADPAPLRERIAAAGLADRVDVRDPVPPEQAVAALAGHDVGVVFDRPVTRNAELSLPNKLFEYLMAGLAVVAPKLPGLDLVEREELGLTYAPGRPADLAARLEELAGDRDRLEAFRANARSAAVERYNAAAQRAPLEAAWGARRDA